MNFVIIGIPESVNSKSIVEATVAFCKSVGVECHAEVMEGNLFEVNSNNDAPNRAICEFKKLADICTSSGTKNIAGINANFWRLIEDGKLTKESIFSMIEYELTVKQNFKHSKYPIEYIYQLIQSAIKVM